MLFVGVRHVQTGVLSTTGDLLIVMGYLAQLYGPMETISQKVGDLQSSLASAERAFELLDETPDVHEKPHAGRLGRARGAIEFRDVSFGYDGQISVLRDISFAIRPGTRLGIVGKTGAGKTTLVSLVTRFYDPTAGAILLDGVDLRDYRLADLRNQFGIVLQEPVLFSTSIAENIAYAQAGALAGATSSPRREAANAHEFIRALPGRLRHGRRRARHAPLGRRAPAHRTRTRVPEGRADPDPRRADELGGHEHRGRDHGGDASG